MLRRNVLIFHQAALGDFVLTWPLAMAMSRIFPQSRIFYVTHSQKGALARKVLRIESIDAEAGWHWLYADDPQLPEPAKKLLEAAHTVAFFSSREESDSRFAKNIATLAPHANVVELSTKPTPAAHVSESLVDQMSAVTGLGEATRQMLRSIASRGVGHPLKPSGRIVVHPGAGSAEKCWPAEKYLELLKALRAAGRSVRVLLGEVETQTWAVEKIARFASATEVSRPTNLLEMLDEIAAADVFIGNDSGPGHLAGILGVPTVSIFGPTDPNVWQPLGPRVKIIAASSFDLISVDQVLAAIQK